MMAQQAALQMQQAQIQAAQPQEQAAQQPAAPQANPEEDALFTQLAEQLNA